MYHKEFLLKNILNLIEKHKITAYEIEQNTELSAVGVQKIINGETKKPLISTLKTIENYINNKYMGRTISGDNHRINQGGVYNEDSSFISKELITLLHKKDEQIDKLLEILRNK